MRAVPKPDASYASNHPTRRNASPGHPVSSYNELTPADVNITANELKSNGAQPAAETNPGPGTDDEPMSSDEEEIQERQPDAAQPSIEEQWEPAIDAEPLSSDEEQASDSESLPDRRQINYTVTTNTLEQKLAKSSGSQSSSQVRHGRSHRESLSRKHSLMGSDDDEDSLFMSSGCSQPKRRKATQYSLKNPKPAYFNQPVVPKRRQAENPSPVIEAPKEPEETFIVPKNIESPSFKATRGGEELNFSFSLNQYSIEDFEGDSVSSLSSPSASILNEFSDNEENAAKKHREPSPPRKALCPLCQAEVDWELLEVFKAQSKQRIREQVKFCESHNRHTAAESWEQRGYPQIDWDRFEERVQSYFPKIEKLLVPGASSYYRNMLDTSLVSGQAKNLRLTAEDGKGLEMMSCGYYGAKGSTKMVEILMPRFSVLVRRLALSDDLIQAVGVAGYTQSVLVPELAVLMVKDDMKINDEDARQILRESMEIGNRINPDHNVVPVPEEAESGPGDEVIEI